MVAIGEIVMRIKSIRHRSHQHEATDEISAPEDSGNTLSEAQAATYLGMSAAWLKKSRTRRFLQTADAPPFIRNGKRRIVYRRADLDEWQRRHLQHVGPLPLLSDRSF
jgi:predicted DNA-binding transcriptional regulator AlpA